MLSIWFVLPLRRLPCRRMFSPMSCSRFFSFAGVKLLEEFPIVLVPAGEFYAHAVFQGGNRCLDRPSDIALHPAGGSIRKMDGNIEFSAGFKRVACPDEETVAREITRNGTAGLAFSGELYLEPADKPFASSARSQKGS